MSMTSSSEHHILYIDDRNPISFYQKWRTCRISLLCRLLTRPIDIQYKAFNVYSPCFSYCFLHSLVSHLSRAGQPRLLFSGRDKPNFQLSLLVYSISILYCLIISIMICLEQWTSRCLGRKSISSLLSLHIREYSYFIHHF